MPADRHVVPHARCGGPADDPGSRATSPLERSSSSSEASGSAAPSVALVSPGWPVERFANGVVTYVGTLAPALGRVGHRVSILAGEVAGDAEDGSVYCMERFSPVRSVPERVLEAFAFRIAPRAAWRRRLRRSMVRAVRTMISERAVELLEMDESFGAAAWLKESLSIPICVRLHGPWFLNGPATGIAEDDAFRERVRAEGVAIAAADGVSAPSHDVLERVRRRYGIALEDAEVIPNPVAPVPAGERWDVDACERGLILFVGRFDRHKGGDLMIEAFSHVLRRVRDARLAFVGPDRGLAAEDGRLWSFVDFTRDRLPGGMELGRVAWSDQQPSSALHALRRRACVTVVCSRYESFAYTLVEAMATGCPVVATRVGGIPEIVRDGSNGVLCRPDAGELAERIAELMTDRARSAALGRQAALDCERLMHPNAIASQVAAFHRRVLARRGADLRDPTELEPRIRTRRRRTSSDGRPG